MKYTLNPYKIALFLGFLCPMFGQAQDTIPHTLQDSLRFAQQVHAWTSLPSYKDSLFDWQITTVTAVLNEKLSGTQALFERDYLAAAMVRTQIEASHDAIKADTTVAKDSIAAVAETLKLAKKEEKNTQKNYASAVSAKTQMETALAQPAKTQRKNLPKNFKKWADLEKKYAQIHALPEPAAVAPPPAEMPAVVESATLDTASVDTSAQSGNRLGQLKKILKPKEKQPEKPKPYQYDARQDVMITPPALPCTFALERKDEFTGVVYKETQKVELFRFTNNVMKKALPEGQPHIICLAGMASEGSDAKILLEFTIKDLNARRTFGGLAPKSILSLRFLDGELATIFNEANQEGQFDVESGTAVFRGVYTLPSSVLRKLEKNELDQIRVAWSTGYEDYNVQHIGLFQQLSNCIK